VCLKLPSVCGAHKSARHRARGFRSGAVVLGTVTLADALGAIESGPGNIAPSCEPARRLPTRTPASTVWASEAPDRCSSIRCMRTTISLDDDVLLAVQERARRERRTAGAVLSELARQALTSQRGRAEPPDTERHGFAPLPRRGAAVSNALIDRLREDEPE